MECKSETIETQTETETVPISIQTDPEPVPIMISQETEMNDPIMISTETMTDDQPTEDRETTNGRANMSRCHVIRNVWTLYDKKYHEKSSLRWRLSKLLFTS